MKQSKSGRASQQLKAGSYPEARLRGGRPPKFPAIKEKLRSAILQGRFKHDEQLPSFHHLAKELGVGGPTAKKAIDALVEEGWLESLHGVGTFVRLRKTASQILLTAPRRGACEPIFSAENLEAFHKAHPNVRVTLTADPAPDFLFMDSYQMVADQIRERRLLSLDELWDRFGRRDWKIPAIVRKYGTCQGSWLALPLRLEIYVLMINPAVLERFGLRPPVRTMDWTQYRDVLRRCREDRDGDGFVECVGALSKLALSEWLIPFWQRGGRLDEYEAFFDPKALSVLDELFDMHHLEKTFPFEMPIGQDETPSGLIAERFRRGQVAMRWGTTTSVLFQPMPFPFSIVLPRFGPVERQQSHGVVLGIDRECRHPDVALEFLDFCYQRFIRGNTEYPFAMTEEQRRMMRQMPEIHRLLKEGLE